MSQVVVNTVPLEVFVPGLELKNLVSSFSEYNIELNRIWHEMNRTKPHGSSDVDVQNCTVMRYLRRLIPIEDLRETGTFFTGDRLANEAVSQFSCSVTTTSAVLDPTCGAGSLLLACSKKLPVTNCLYETMSMWGKVLCGWDIFPEFIEATKMRIILEGINRGCAPNDYTLSQLKTLLKNIRQANALLEEDSCANITHVIMNPPYVRVNAPKQCTWGGGKINAAGVFLEHILDKVPNNTEVVAVLPEVLRSGARYEIWRSMLKTKMSYHNFKIAGRFDSKTNVDVFILKGCTRRGGDARSSKITTDTTASKTISDYFDLSVGPVVPHRDPEAGDLCPYVYPKMLPVWKEITEISTLRRFKGRLYQPPLVLIRRTSGPRDKNRAGATLILDDKPIAVENHLIVAVPKASSVEECRRLLKVLQNPQTTVFLNTRIRCRHLTVGSISEIPWVEEY